MAKYIELIDKYRIEQGEGDYNPPSYVWVDNTGEIVRCKDCKFSTMTYQGGMIYCKKLARKDEYGDFGQIFYVSGDWFCADGEREEQE